MNDRILKKLNKKATLLLLKYENFLESDFSDDFQDLYFTSDTEDGRETESCNPYYFLKSYVNYCRDTFEYDEEADHTICVCLPCKNPSHVFKEYVKFKTV